MNGLLHHLGISLRLHFRNKMALLYGYLFPLMFLMAFWVLYRYERVPLVRHMGELLTVTVLGGACFGLPTTMVSERERGVWRRYRLAPVSTRSLVASTVAARYVILITAGILQLAVAMAAGMPLPHHLLDLWIAFTCVSFAFLGLGLVMAMMADNVPAVQALGQCIFLPMLIIGGVAVQLASLPPWAQHVSAFFPGRYAVEALQTSVTGGGLGAARFNLFALLLIGAAGCLAGAKMFRWDAQQRFALRSGKGWIAVAVAAWIAVGLIAESRGRISTRTPGAAEHVAATTAPGPAGAIRPETAAPEPPVPAPRTPEAHSPTPSPPASPAPGSSPAPNPVASSAAAKPPVNPTTPPVAPSDKGPATTAHTPSGASSWQAVTIDDIDRDLVFDRLPSDRGVVTPIAPFDEEVPPDVIEEVENLRRTLPEWKPGKVADPVQRVRNYLYVVAVPDVLQTPLERYAPLVVFERLQQDIPKDQLIKILYWIALHPTEGDDTAVDQLWALGIDNGAGDMEQTRDRAAIYGVKLLGRLTGKIAQH